MAISDDGAIVVVSGGGGAGFRFVTARRASCSARSAGCPDPPTPSWRRRRRGRVHPGRQPGHRLAVAGPIRVVDPHTGAELRRFDSPQETSNLDVFFTRDGTEMVTVGSRGMMRFDVASGEPLWLGAAARVPFCPTWAYAERIGALLCGDPRVR